MTEVTAYHNPNAPIERQWIAYVVMDNGNLWGVYSVGDTEECARAKIANLWESEHARPLGLIPRLRDHKPEVFLEPPSLPASWGEIAPEVKTNREHATKGMVWLVHKFNRTKCRVAPASADHMIASGDWERGGPRSK